MTSLAFEFALSNTILSLPVACMASIVQRSGRSPALAHLLWLIVLIKLVTPPLLSFPLIPGGSVPELDVALSSGVATTDTPAGAFPVPGWFAAINWPGSVLTLWLIGSVSVLLASLSRILRFNRLLRTTSVRADESLEAEAASAGRLIGIDRIPEVRVTSAAISPMVWWLGRRVRIYLPRSLIDSLPAPERRAILAHEIGHVRRGDHFVRWLELVVSVAMWWNPLACLARRNLRRCEEACCDALVLDKLDVSRRIYAGALIGALAALANPSVLVPRVASNALGIGTAERRIGMILSRRSVIALPKAARVTLLALAIAAAPVGFGFAQEYGSPDRAREWIQAGVDSAFLTAEQAELMLRVLEGQQGGRNLIVLQDRETVVSADDRDLSSPMTAARMAQLRELEAEMARLKEAYLRMTVDRTTLAAETAADAKAMSEALRQELDALRARADQLSQPDAF